MLRCVEGVKGSSGGSSSRRRTSDERAGGLDFGCVLPKNDPSVAWPLPVFAFFEDDAEFAEEVCALFFPLPEGLA